MRHGLLLLGLLGAFAAVTAHAERFIRDGYYFTRVNFPDGTFAEIQGEPVATAFASAPGLLGQRTARAVAAVDPYTGVETATSLRTNGLGVVTASDTVQTAPDGSQRRQSVRCGVFGIRCAVREEVVTPLPEPDPFGNY